MGGWDRDRWGGGIGGGVEVGGLVDDGRVE